jgi:hypothetical protein
MARTKQVTRRKKKAGGASNMSRAAALETIKAGTSTSNSKTKGGKPSKKGGKTLPSGGRAPTPTTASKPANWARNERKQDAKWLVRGFKRLHIDSKWAEPVYIKKAGEQTSAGSEKEEAALGKDDGTGEITSDTDPAERETKVTHFDRKSHLISLPNASSSDFGTIYVSQRLRADEIDQTAKIRRLLAPLAARTPSYAMLFGDEFIFRKAFAKANYQHWFDGMGAGLVYSSFYKTPGPNKVRAGFFVEYSGAVGVEDPTTIVQKHAWAAILFPATATRPKTIFHWDGNVLYWKGVYKAKYKTTCYRRHIMTKAHRDLSDLCGQAEEWLGGPSQPKQNACVEISLTWLQRVLVKQSVDEAFEETCKNSFKLER